MRRALQLALALVVLLATFEVLGRTIVFRDRLYFVDDVDHRPAPHSGRGINADGIRSPVESTAFDPDDRNLIVLGDSFMYGLRLAPEAAPPMQLEALARQRHPGLRVRVANFGWISASPLLQARQLREIGARYHPDWVIQAIDMTDFRDDLKYRRLLERPGVYRVVPIVPVSFMATSRLLSAWSPLDPVHRLVYGFPARRMFAADAPLEETRPYLGELERNVEATRRVAEDELGARFLLAVFPRGFQYSDRESPHNWEASQYTALGPYVLEPFRFFEELAARVDHPVALLLSDFAESDVFPHCFDDDPHWTEAGAAVAAEALYRACSESGCFDATAGSGPGV